MDLFRTHLGEPQINRHDMTPWRSLSARLHIDLPADYVEFVNAYGPGWMDRFLEVYHPEGPGRTFESNHAEVVDEFVVVPEEDLDVIGFYPKVRNGLLPWGSSSSGDRFFFRLISDAPDQWPTVVYSRGLMEVYHFDGGFTDLLRVVFGGGCAAPWFENLGWRDGPGHSFVPHRTYW